MSRNCSVPLCGNRSQDNVSLHRFPRDTTNRYDVWVARLGRIDLFMKTKSHVYRGYRVCGAHFSKEQWNGHTTSLLKNAVPDLNLPYEYCNFLSSVVEKDHNYASVIIDEVPRSSITNQEVISQDTIEYMLICDNVVDILNIKSTHICLFCMKVLHKTTEFNIQSDVTKEGTILEGFIKTSLLISMDEELESYFVCLNCLNMVNELEEYLMKCKNIQECLMKQYAEHKQSKENKNHSLDEELLMQNAVEDGRQIIDSANQSHTKDYATRETQTYTVSTQLEDGSILRGLLSKSNENEMNENINKPDKQSIPKEKKIKIDPHSSSGYCCDKCGKVFWKYNAYYKHELFHRNENKYRCEICNKTFAQQSNLTLHGLIHSGILPHECEICGKKFRVHASLYYHKKSVHPSAEDSSGYCCETCGKLYVSYYGFQMHIRSHKYENKLRCEICDKTFTQISGLNSHKMTHLDILPFECKLCGKTFRNNTKLKTHLNMHNGIRNYQCSTCGKAFYTKVYLTNHMNIHLTIKPFICAVCGRGFAHRCNMTKHVKVVHKNKNI